MAAKRHEKKAFEQEGATEAAVDHAFCSVPARMKAEGGRGLRCQVSGVRIDG
jgi:hypothetical protein